MTKLTKHLVMLIVILAMTGCYHPDIQQGNNLKAQQVTQLKFGMSQIEVVQLLGSPVLQNVFNPNELVYIYTDLPPYSDLTERKMTLIFTNGKLSKIEGASSFPA